MRMTRMDTYAHTEIREYNFRDRDFNTKLTEIILLYHKNLELYGNLTSLVLLLIMLPTIFIMYTMPLTAS